MGLVNRFVLIISHHTIKRKEIIKTHYR